MTIWHEEAAEELTRYARSKRRGAGNRAGQLYQFAKALTPRRAGELPKLSGANPDIRWWDFGEMTIYFRIAPMPIAVVKVGATRTPQQRGDCERDARARS